MRRLTALFAALAVAVSVGAFTPQPVAAQNCGAGSVYLYDGENQTGGYVRYCYNTGDSNMDGGILTYNMGPDANGNYHRDFNTYNAGDSGIRSMRFYDNSTDSTNINVCFYSQAIFSQTQANTMAFVHTPGSYNFPTVTNPGGFPDNTPGEFRFSIGGNNNSGDCY